MYGGPKSLDEKMYLRVKGSLSVSPFGCTASWAPGFYHLGGKDSDGYRPPLMKVPPRLTLLTCSSQSACPSRFNPPSVKVSPRRPNRSIRRVALRALISSTAFHRVGFTSFTCTLFLEAPNRAFWSKLGELPRKRHHTRLLLPAPHSTLAVILSISIMGCFIKINLTLARSGSPVTLMTLVAPGTIASPRLSFEI